MSSPAAVVTYGRQVSPQSSQLADQIGWRNIHHVRLGVEFAAFSKLVLKGGDHDYWLASATDAPYAPGGTLIVRMPAEIVRRLGQEIDIQASWAARSDLVRSAGYANLMPARFLEEAARGAGYQYPFEQMIFSF